MVKCINKKSHVFTHVYVDIPRLRKKLCWLVYKVSSKNLIDNTLFVSFIELIKAVSEKTKCSGTEYSACTSLLQLRSNIYHTFTRRYHIVNNDNILALYVSTKEFMGNDRVTSVNNLSIISSLIEHTHIKAKYIGKVYSTSHTTLIRAYYHHMFAVDMKIIYAK